MKIVIMRHGDAAHEAGRDDLRPLTDLGRAQSMMMAEWVKDQFPRIDRVLVSPFLRAQQTWETIQPILPKPAVVEFIHDLIPYGRVEPVADYIRTLEDEYLLVISHLPLVGYIVNELCVNTVPPMFVTSGMAGLTITDGHGKLDWQKSPHTI